MMSIVTEPSTDHETHLAVVSCLPEETGLSDVSIATAIVHPNPTTQMLLSSKLNIHIPEAGLNPLVDAAAYLFSFMGKLCHVKSSPNLKKLHDELIEEIENFTKAIQDSTYSADHIAEYLPITTYALCVTFDDIISNTGWGNQGKWDEYNLVTTFTPEPPANISFFIILERLIRDPDIYIDVMEFMYICLNFGFKCRHNSTSSEFDHEQLEQIINSLYKRIRAYRGTFSKVLSPFPIKTLQPKTTTSFIHSFSPRTMTLIASIGCLAFLAVGLFMVNHVKPTKPISTQVAAK